MALREPDYDRQVDLEGLIRQLPPRLETTGFLFNDLLRQVRAKLPTVDLFARAGITRHTYFPFINYPQEEWLRLHYHAALVLFPDVATGEALRRLGRTAFDSFYATTVGRRLMALVARDTQQLLLRGPMAYRFSGNFGRFSTELVGKRHVRATVREYPEFLEHYHTGVIEGALLHTGSRAIIRVDVLAVDAADFEIRWEPLADQSDDADAATAKKWTSTGVTAALDIALRMIEEEDGQPLAFEVAQWLVMYLRRAGGQTPVKASLARQSAEHEPIAETLVWASQHLAEDLSVDALARHARMSTRNFARIFVTELGTSPAAYVEQLRIEEAQRLLATTRRSLKEIAQATGFRSATVLSRAFFRLLGLTPDEYRRRG
jgi:uncharacterized protein (TIGR02265 family)